MLRGDCVVLQKHPSEHSYRKLRHGQRQDILDGASTSLFLIEPASAGLGIVLVSRWKQVSELEAIGGESSLLHHRITKRHGRLGPQTRETFSLACRANAEQKHSFQWRSTAGALPPGTLSPEASLGSDRCRENAPECGHSSSSAIPELML